MKYIVLFLLMLSTVFAAQNVDLSITQIGQSPDPVEPGDIVEIDFKIENLGDETTDDVIIQINPEYPLSSYNGITEINLGKLPASVSGSHTETITFKLKVHEDAVGGNVDLDVKILHGFGGFNYDDGEFNVDIENNDAILQISAIDVFPDKVEAGDIVQIDISLLNTANTVIRDVTYELDLDEVPFAPYQSSRIQQIDVIGSGTQSVIEYNLLVDPQASSGLYKVDSIIKFYDDTGDEHTLEDILAISVYETPQLRTYVKRNNIDSKTGQGDVTIEIANAGISNLKLVEIIVEQTPEFTLLSPTNYFYIGDIDSDDTESEDIMIHTETRGQINVPLTINYRDLNNMQYSENVEVPISVLSTRNTYKYGLAQRSYGGIIALLVLASVIAGIVWYKRKK